MQYWRKIIGVAVVLIMGDGFWDVILGLLVDHIFDKARMHKMAWFANQRERQTLSLATTFKVMGRLTKSRGRVMEAGIHIASQLMDRMNLYGDSRMAVRHTFRVGKSDSYPLREKAHQFRSVCFGRFDLAHMFLKTQIRAAFIDGSLHPNEREVLCVIAEELGISRTQFGQFLRIMQGGTQFGGRYQQRSGDDGWQQTQRGPTLEDTCNVLGVKATDNATTIERAYRKLMSEHHPDKLVTKSLPPEMMEITKQEAQEIQKAYELIKDQKRFK